MKLSILNLSTLNVLKRLRYTLAIIACVFSVHSIAQSLDPSKPQPRLPTVTLDIAGVLLKTEIADTTETRYMGLSHRKSLAEYAAMLFVYKREQSLVFTMRNTLLPLSIAYISEDLVINEIHDMPVGDNLLFPAEKPAMFALEVNQGWFERNDVNVGDQIIMNP